MGVLDSTKLYLPFEFIIVNKQLLIKEDCSKEQLFPKYSVIKSIGGVSTKILLSKMLEYIPADGVNQTFKYYNLYNYFYFHHLYNLFYPEKNAFKIELENNNTHYYIQGLKAREIDSIYQAKNKQSVSTYGKQLAYRLNAEKKTSYVRVSSFYKGLIENFGQKYELFLDSVFTHIKSRNIENLILDLRNNEGGGDGYDNLLLSYLLYNYRKNTTRKILFIGEENGGDLYSGSGCAGQGYTIKLPNSAIQVDMPFLCFGELKKEYPKKRLPDYPVYDKINDLLNNKDTVLEFAIKLYEAK